MTAKIDERLLWPSDIGVIACEKCQEDAAVFALSMHAPGSTPEQVIYLCFDCLFGSMLGAVADYVTDNAAYQAGIFSGKALREKYGRIHEKNEARRKAYREQAERTNVRPMQETFGDDGSRD